MYQFFLVIREVDRVRGDFPATIISGVVVGVCVGGGVISVKYVSGVGVEVIIRYDCDINKSFEKEVREKINKYISENEVKESSGINSKRNLWFPSTFL